MNVPSSPAGSRTAKAGLTKNAYGKTYKFDLHPSETAPFTPDAHVIRNFQWKLSETRPDGGFYGAHVDVYPFGTSVSMTDVKLIFTPFTSEQTLIDGSPAVSFERNLEDVSGTYMIQDIPPGVRCTWISNITTATLN